MTIYEGITLGFIGIGIIFIILSFFYDKTKHSVMDDNASMDDEVFRKEVNLVNEKIVELNDYHNFIQQELEKKHKELLFIYQMITEKEKSLKDIKVEVEQLKISIEEMTETLDDRQEIHSTKIVNEKKLDDCDIEQDVVNVGNRNKRIIELKRNGYKSKEIAKILNIGYGEVELVLNLYE